MKLQKYCSTPALIALFFFGAGIASAAPKPSRQPAAQAGLLPKGFAGWEKASSQTSTDAAVADASHPELLKEYGFAELETAVYTRPDGRQLNLRAARFADATGAYGAFTFYREPDMLEEQYGDKGASFNNRALFYRGSVLIEAALDKVTAMSAAELRELSNLLPLPAGPARNLPTLPQYLPREGIVDNSEKYIEGPVALAAIGSPISAGLVDFARGPEVCQAKYSTSAGTATLMLIAYPTPQIAGERLRQLQSINQNSLPPGDASLMPPFTLKRTGPIVALLAGQIPSEQAKAMLASIHYDAEVTWNENTHFDKRNNIGNLLVNIIVLISIILAISLAVGVAFGGARIFVKRFFPGKVFDRPEDVELIQLRLEIGDKNR